MKALIATILVAGILTGCHIFVTGQPNVEYSGHYWVHGGRVYQKDRPGNFYVFEGGKKVSHIQDPNYIDRIEKEGKLFRNYNDANEHLRRNHGNK